jgi:hypothetical protein
MSKLFTIEMLPARHGDCLWIEYGEPTYVRRILIDGGPVSTFPFIEQRIAQVPMGERSLELVVLTHVDADHVEGLVRFFASNPVPLVVKRVWFNGWRQMEQAHGLLGAMQGEFLSALLVRRTPAAWDQDAKPWVVPDAGPLPTTPLDGRLTLTLLSPTVKKLDQMRAEWKSVMEKAGIKPGDLDAAWKKLGEQKKFLPTDGLLGNGPNLDELLEKLFLQDKAKPNGSSIAMLAEYGGKSILLLADAHPDAVASGIRRLCAARGIPRLRVEAVKVAHHGSKNNTSEELLGLIESPIYLVSTNGDQFQHPDEECIARIIRYGKPEKLYFNYETQFTKPWLSADAQSANGYAAVVRKDADLSLKLALL